MGKKDIIAQGHTDLSSSLDEIVDYCKIALKDAQKLSIEIVPIIFPGEDKRESTVTITIHTNLRDSEFNGVIEKYAPTN